MAAAKGRKPSAYPKTVEVDGISVTIKVDPANDWELAESSLTLNDPAATQLDRARAIARQCRIVLGDGYDRVMGELRELNGGALPISAVMSFVNRAIAAEGGDAKN